MHPGVSVKQSSKSKPYIRYINRGEEEDRTHESFVKIYKQRLSIAKIKGVKSISCLSAAKGFDMTLSFGIDYMHCFLLGVLNKLSDLWLSPKNHKQQFYIKHKSQDILKKRLLSIKPTSEITRKPRSITERADFKANELRSMLLYYLTFSLTGLLKKCYVDHFQLLSSGTYILLKEKITKEELDIAEQKLIRFSNEFATLYGQHNVTINIHLAKHAGKSVRHLGPLWAQSAFGMEANNGVLKKLQQKIRFCIKLLGNMRPYSKYPVSNEGQMTIVVKCLLEVKHQLNSVKRIFVRFQNLYAKVMQTENKQFIVLY